MCTRNICSAAALVSSLLVAAIYCFLGYRKQQMDWPSIIVAESTKLFIGLYPKRDLSNIGEIRATFNKMLRSVEGDECGEQIPYFDETNITSLNARAKRGCKKVRRMFDYTLHDYDDTCEENGNKHTCSSTFNHDGIDMRVYEPYDTARQATEKSIIVWVHGGGFVIGHHHDNAKCVNLANLTGSIVISIEYRFTSIKHILGSNHNSPCSYTGWLLNGRSLMVGMMCSGRFDG